MEEEHPKEAQRKEDFTKSPTQTDATRTPCLPKMTQGTIKATMPGNTETKHKKMMVMQMMLKPTNMPAILKRRMARTFKTWTEIMRKDLSSIDMRQEELMISFNRSSLLTEERRLMSNSTSRTGTGKLEEDQMLSWPTMMRLKMRKKCFKT